MARRLARWLLTATPIVASLQTAVAWQSDEGAFVDWARFRLLGGDEIPDLSQAYSACREALIARRNKFAKPFAQALMRMEREEAGASTGGSFRSSRCSSMYWRRSPPLIRPCCW